MVTATGGRLHRALTVAAASQSCPPSRGVLGDGRTVAISAEAFWLARLPALLRRAGQRQTVGVGRLIAKPVQGGYLRLIIGLGVSATNDGGIGLAAAIGFQFLDRADWHIPLNGFGLARLEWVVPPKHLSQPEVVAATDVTDPLCGRDDAAHRYASQKGASPENVRRLDQNLWQLTRVVRRCLGHSPQLLSPERVGQAVLGMD